MSSSQALFPQNLFLDQENSKFLKPSLLKDDAKSIFIPTFRLSQFK